MKNSTTKNEGAKESKHFNILECKIYCTVGNNVIGRTPCEFKLDKKYIVSIVKDFYSYSIINR